ncbi:MAG: phosphatidylglycerophosphatase A [Bacteriovoracaceae bacterium]|jgi:phosphatidylglycerophosphatase A|nr:phosphatidylglycerophosphatase A [Bacteriovoracaceae bacterium]
MKAQKLNKFFLSLCGIGFIPFAPGTLGSLGTIPLIYLFSILKLNIWLYIAIISLLIIASSLLTEKIQRSEGLHDPQWIVIDETIGMLISYLAVYPTFNSLDIFLLFGIFRIFDIFKIFPATYFDQKVKHGFGTIFDDCISGFYAAIIVFLLTKYLL